MSLRVPGYDVDSLTTRVSSETYGAIPIVAFCKRERSGSRLTSRGVGTQIVITEAAQTLEKSVVAIYMPLDSAICNLASEISSTGLEPELICKVLASRLSTPMTVQPASTAAIAKGRPT